MGLGAWGLGLGVWGLGFGVWGLGSGVCGLRIVVLGLGFGFLDLGLLGFGFSGLGFEIWVLGSGFGVLGFGFGVSSFGFGIWGLVSDQRSLGGADGHSVEASKRREKNLKWFEDFLQKTAQAKALTGPFAPSWLDNGTPRECSTFRI